MAPEHSPRVVEVRAHPLGAAVYYAGTILLIGTRAEALAMAKVYAKKVGASVRVDR